MPNPRRIYVLGAGSIGKFVAHSLAGIPNRPPITLLLPNSSAMTRWKRDGEALYMNTKGLMEKRTDFEAELSDPEMLSDPRLKANPQQIHNLVVAVKCPSTVPALRALKERLKPDSTVLFLQNGLGVIDEVNREVFPDASERPQYMQGVVSHGVYSVDRFEVKYQGAGTISLGLVLPQPHGQDHDAAGQQQRWLVSSRYILRTFTRTPILGAVALAPPDLLMLQMEKLAVNCVINPLTAVMDCRNGELHLNDGSRRTMRLLLAEISLVIRSLPELQIFPDITSRFSSAKLEIRVDSIIKSTAENHSSMWVDVQRGSMTEIDFMNGYIIRRGDELGIRCVVNYAVMEMIIGKSRIIARRHMGLRPLQKL